jgi:hypothetical protein
MVDAIWADMGLRYPPAVTSLSRQARSTIARADRLSILLSDWTPSWCLLHELAHAMTSHADGRSDGHQCCRTHQVAEHHGELPTFAC